MARHFVRIHFPNGKILCASFSTYDDTVGVAPSCQHIFQDDEVGFIGLYTPNIRDGKEGFITTRSNFEGEPQPWRKNAPRSSPDELILVKIVEDPPDSTWHALYCPSRLELLGPMSQVTSGQNEYALLPDHNGLLHLADSNKWYDSFINSTPLPALCGAVMLDTREGLIDYEDLYAEWNKGIICRNCLLHPNMLEMLNPNMLEQEAWAQQRRLELLAERKQSSEKIPVDMPQKAKRSICQWLGF